jgi:hypothetical protein
MKLSDEKEIDRFIGEYVEFIEGGSAAVFAGAGLSASAGYVDWKGLLKPFAEELKLDVEKEHDLVTLAQYYVNHNQNIRTKLTQVLIEKFDIAPKPTENHHLLAQMPIATYWTTNYDRLIETAIENSGKIPHSKYSIQHLSVPKKNVDAVIYKMHGDVSQAHEAILTKDDYENYSDKYAPFISALKGDLVSKTFLFLGFGFTDPNLDYILSRIRIGFTDHARRHYAIFKMRSPDEFQSAEDLEYALNKQSYFINDLRRFNIHSILVENYSDIEKIIRRINYRVRLRTVFISGAISDFDLFSEDSVDTFCRELGNLLALRGLKVSSGFGLGIGTPLVSGAMDAINAESNLKFDSSLNVRPFPRSQPDADKRKKVYTKFREELIEPSGVSVFLFGNKIVEGKTVNASGMMEEYEISVEQGNLNLPIAATGYLALEIYEKEKQRLEGLFDGCGDEAQKLWSEVSNCPSSEHLALMAA